MIFALLDHHLEPVCQDLGRAEAVGGATCLEDQRHIWYNQGDCAEEKLDVGRYITMETGLVVDGDEEGDVAAESDLGGESHFGKLYKQYL